MQSQRLPKKQLVNLIHRSLKPLVIITVIRVYKTFTIQKDMAADIEAGGAGVST